MIKTAGALLLLVGAAAPGQGPASAPAADPVPGRLAALARHLAAKSAPAAALAPLAAEPGRGDAADLALAAAFPAYGEALGRLAAGDPAAPLGLARLAADDEADPYVRLHARHHLGRALLETGDPEGAAQALAEFFAGPSALSPLEAEAAFFYGIALSRIPSREEAINVLAAFLKGYPWAPERHRALATQVLEELRRPEANPIHGVADEMKAVERKLGKGEAGDETTGQERRILDRLDELIERLEEQERQGGGGAGGGGRPQSPAQSATPPAPGEAKIGELAQGARRAAARWGELRDRERERILQELDQSFPPRYRAILESYFKKLSGGK